MEERSFSVPQFPPSPFQKLLKWVLMLKYSLSDICPESLRLRRLCFAVEPDVRTGHAVRHLFVAGDFHFHELVVSVKLEGNLIADGAGGNNIKAMPTITKFDVRELKDELPEGERGLYDIDVVKWIKRHVQCVNNLFKCYVRLSVMQTVMRE